MKFYKDAAGEWRWQIKGDNGEIIGASSEGYKEKRSAEENAETLADALADWSLEREEPEEVEG